MKFSARWVLVGALVVIGSMWFGLQILGTAQVFDETVRHVVVGVLCGGAGALLAGFAPVRPWQEPVLAVLVALAISIAAVLVSPWSSAALAEMGPELLLKWSLICACAMIGAAAMQKLAPRFRPGPGALVVLCATLTTGVATPLITMMELTGTRSFVAQFFVTLGSSILAGFLTQGSIQVRRPWLCGLGGGLLALRVLSSGSSHVNYGGVLMSGCLLVALGSVGARLAWRLMVRRGHVEDVDVPAAHAS